MPFFHRRPCGIRDGNFSCSETAFWISKDTTLALRVSPSGRCVGLEDTSPPLGLKFPVRSIYTENPTALATEPLDRLQCKYNKTVELLDCWCILWEGLYTENNWHRPNKIKNKAQRPTLQATLEPWQELGRAWYRSFTTIWQIGRTFPIGIRLYCLSRSKQFK